MYNGINILKPIFYILVITSEYMYTNYIHMNNLKNVQSTKLAQKNLHDSTDFIHLVKYIIPLLIHNPEKLFMRGSRGREVEKEGTVHPRGNTLYFLNLYCKVTEKRPRTASPPHPPPPGIQYHSSDLPPSAPRENFLYLRMMF